MVFIAAIVVIVGGLLVFVIGRVIHAHQKQATTGREELIGKKAVVKVALDPEGTILYKGERWTAVSDKSPVKPGEEVIITGVNGLILRVTKKTAEEINI